MRASSDLGGNGSGAGSSEASQMRKALSQMPARMLSGERS